MQQWDGVVCITFFLFLSCTCIILATMVIHRLRISVSSVALLPWNAFRIKIGIVGVSELDISVSSMAEQREEMRGEKRVEDGRGERREERKEEGSGRKSRGERGEERRREREKNEEKTSVKGK